ncbi:MAG: AgmX/PglI C-terminal domain-containing protein [Myxococcota bacterium]
MVQRETPVSLTYMLPDGTSRAVEFPGSETISIGSGDAAQMVLAATGVSSLHAMLKPKDGGFVVMDLGSDEGTMLNGRELLGETALEDGDQLDLGPVRLVVHFGGAMLEPTVPVRAAIQPTVDEPTVRGPAPTAAVASVAKTPDPSPLPSRRAEAHEPTQRVERPRRSAKKSDERKAATGAHEKSLPAAAPPPPSLSGAGKSMSKRHDDTAGHHVKAGELKTELNAEEKPKTTGNIEVTMMWGGSVMGVRRLSGAGAVRIGQAATNDFQIADASLPSPSVDLVTLDASGATIRVADGMALTVDKKAASTGAHRLELGQRAVVRVGAVEFVIQYSERYKPIDLGLFQTLDFFYSKVLGVALIFQLTLVVAMLITPSFDEDDDDDLFKNPNEFAALILKQPEEKKEKKEDLSGKKAARHKDDEGKFGKKDKPQEDKLASKKGAPKVDKDKREEDRKLAMDALAALGLKGPEGAVSNVLGPGGLGSGINDSLGGLRGSAMGDAGGAGGLGSRGTGAGGGGNSLGIGGLGSGTGRGSGGQGGIDLGGRGKGMTRIQPGNVITQGSLSKEEIERVVRRNLNQIKYCYEKELAKDPNLEGKLVGTWTVGGTGSVVSASISQNTMGNAAVATCVERVIQRMKFPAPRGGGQVFVTFNFVFRGSGS